jgi:hypothetical protein
MEEENDSIQAPVPKITEVATKPKRQLTDKQREALERGRVARLNGSAKKQAEMKSHEDAVAKKLEMLELVDRRINELAKGKGKKPKPVVVDDAEDDAEEEVVVVKKKAAAKPKKKVVIYQDDDEEEEVVEYRRPSKRAPAQPAFAPPQVPRVVYW